ncbi:hypothetical protein D3C73_1606150 [compost metagenome]
MGRGGSMWIRFPFHNAGFAPERSFLTLAKSNTLSSRSRSFPADSALVSQRGCKTDRTSSTST